MVIGYLEAERGVDICTYFCLLKLVSNGVVLPVFLLRPRPRREISHHPRGHAQKLAKASLRG
jgi:hypothetical protein